jgi:hypothetical protein
MSVINFIRSLLSGQPSPLAPGSKVPRHLAVTNPWHAVSIVPGPQACHKARSLTRVRFLSSQAPRLPIAECEIRRCSCRYRHHHDRRRQARRAADLAASGAYWSGAERRRSGGRRSTDSV